MKHKHLYLLFILFVFSATSQTTLAEYNYLTKEYEIDLETKKGYYFEPINETSSIIKKNGRKITRAIHLSAFKKEADSTTVALLVKLIRLETKAITYVCIPSKKSAKKILKLSKTEFYKLQIDEDDRMTYLQYLWNSLKLLGEVYID